MLLVLLSLALLLALELVSPALAVSLLGVVLARDGLFPLALIEPQAQQSSGEKEDERSPPSRPDRVLVRMFYRAGRRGAEGRCGGGGEGRGSVVEGGSRADGGSHFDR